MKILKDQLSDAVGKNDEDDAKIKEFDVSVYHDLSACYYCIIYFFTVLSQSNDEKLFQCEKILL